MRETVTGAAASPAGGAASAAVGHRGGFGRAMLGFLAALAVVCGGGALALTRVWPAPEAARAVWTSAVLAAVVQMGAFAIARAYARVNFLAVLGSGFLLRLGSLAVYAFVGIKVLALPATPALLSLVGFLVVTTFLEPVFLKS